MTFYKALFVINLLCLILSCVTGNLCGICLNVVALVLLGATIHEESK